MRKHMKIEEKCSPGRPRRVENEGLEPSGALPGAMWAPGGRQEGSKWLLGAARGAKTNYWLDAGPPPRRKVDRFQSPSGAPELPQGVPEALRGAILEVFFGKGARTSDFLKNALILNENLDFRNSWKPFRCDFEAIE